MFAVCVVVPVFCYCCFFLFKLVCRNSNFLPAESLVQILTFGHWSPFKFHLAVDLQRMRIYTKGLNSKVSLSSIRSIIPENEFKL